MIARSVGAMTMPANDARDVALDLLDAVLGGRRPLDAVLADHAGSAALAVRDRAHGRLLTATVLRRLGQLDALIDGSMKRPLRRRDAAVRNILRLGVAQIVFLATPAYAAVDSAVALARRHGHEPQAGLINAVLRRLDREGPALVAAQDAARLNTPDWLWARWCDAYGEATTRAIAAAHMAEPSLDLTLNPSVAGDARTAAAAAGATAGAAGWADRLDAAILPTGTLRRRAAGRIGELPGFDAGAWWVQDAAATLPARLLGDVTGAAVVDLCAAPGGKTAQLAAAGAHVTTVDIAESRLAVVRENLTRLKLTATCRAGDALTFRPEAPPAAVLLDAPCSATGTIRRHPDIPHLKTAADVAAMATLQTRLLKAAVDMLAPGGLLVYAVCSLEPEEGPERIAALLAGGAPVERVPIAAAEIGGLAECVTAAGDLRTLPCHLADTVAQGGGMDGFFACRLRRA